MSRLSQVVRFVFYVSLPGLFVVFLDKIHYQDFEPSGLTFVVHAFIAIIGTLFTMVYGALEGKARRLKAQPEDMEAQYLFPAIGTIFAILLLQLVGSLLMYFG